jgi:hypothetical protein
MAKVSTARVYSLMKIIQWLPEFLRHYSDIPHEPARFIFFSLNGITRHFQKLLIIFVINLVDRCLNINEY